MSVPPTDPVIVPQAEPAARASEASTGRPARKKLQFATLQFPHLPPYSEQYAERIPLLQAFTIAIQNYHRLNVLASRRELRSRLRQLLLPRRYPFHAVECGVFTGNSLLACASLARDAGIPFEMIGLDTFEGLPELSEQDRALAIPGAKYLRKTMFTDTSEKMVRQLLNDAGFQKGVELRKGLFEQTLKTLPGRRYHFVNIDCDLYEPHLQCLRYFYPRMVPGAVLFFDDYHSVEYPMAGKAVDDFLADKPETLLHLRFGEDGPNRTKAFIIKY